MNLSDGKDTGATEYKDLKQELFVKYVASVKCKTTI
jgi:hypothetical protein